MRKKWIKLPRQLLAQAKKIDLVAWRPYFLGLLVVISLAFLIGWIRQLPPKAPKFKALDGETYQYQAQNKLFTSKLGIREEKPIVAFNLPSGENLVFSYAEAVGDSTLNNPEDKSLLFNQVEPGVDLRYETLANGLKEEIILHQPRQKAEDAHVFTFDSTFQGAYPKETIKGFAGATFYDEQGDYLFHFEKPFAIDAAGNRTDDVILQIEEKSSSKVPATKRSGTEETPYLIRLSVDEAWLTDPTRVYPIIIDPTIIHDESSEFATGNFDRSKDTGSGSSPVIESFYQELSADPHTIGLWHFNETSSSSASDKSGNGNNGTATGTTIVDGILGKARSFNGSSDYVEIGDVDAIDNAKTLSACAWVYHDSDSADQQIISNSNSATDGFFLWRDEAAFVSGRTDVYGIFVADGSDTDNVRVESVSNAGLANQWNHVCFTLEIGQEQGLRLYINGLEDPNSPISTTTINNIDAGSNPLRIGSGSGGGSFFHGEIDEVIVSSRIFTAEEIKAAATRSPYSTYTSPVIDLTGVNSWNSFAWTELGIATGDGETLKDTTGLVAQWNFNETSGTTAANNAGSCGASCNASLTGFDSTASQDADPDSSWTANDRRWGAGALTFDGVDTYVTIPDHNSLSFGNGSTDSPFSISMWFNVRAYNTTTGNWLISKRNADASDEYQIVYSADQTISAIVMSGNSNYIGQRTIRPLPVGEWHHMTMTYDGSKSASGIKVYINGKLEQSTVNNVGTYTGTNNGPHPVLIGKPNWTATRFFNGTIDSTYIFARELSAAEILSNYQAGNIELQTRVGSSANANDGSWDAWSPMTSEDLLKSFDLDLSENWIYRRQIPITHTGSAVDEYQVLVENLDTAALIGAGKMQSDCDDIRFTNTSGELLNYSIIGNTCNTSNTQVWVQTDSIPSSGGSTIYLFYGNPSAQKYSDENKTFSYASEKPVAYILDNDVDQLELISLANNNTITHNSVTRSLNKYGTSNFTSISQFGVISAKKPFNADDASDNTDGLVPVSAAGTDFLFTARSTATYTFYAIAPWGNATVDIYNAGGNCTGNNVTSAGATINCATITAGAVRIASTVPVLIFAETTTTDPMILRPASMQKWIGASTQSRVTSGASGADYRYYDSNTASETNPADLGANATVSLGGGTYGNAPAFLVRSVNNPIGFNQYGDGDGSDGMMHMTIPDMSSTYGSAVSNTDYISIASDQAANCTVYNASTKAIVGSGTATSANSAVYFLGFGTGSSSSIVAAPWFMECSAPVAAFYQKGVDSESSLFGASMMRQFTYPTPSVGAIGSEESISSYSGSWIQLNAENQNLISFTTDSVIKVEGTTSQKIQAGQAIVDNSTVALWSFEESGGTGAYIKDASGNGNHGTPTSTTVSNGISGKARTFGGGSENISLGNPASLQLTGDQTIEMWLYPTDMSVRRNPYAKAYGGEGTITQEIAGTLSYYYGTSGANAVPYQGFGTATAIPTNQWSHVAIVRDLTNMQLYWYVNGVLNNQAAASYPAATVSSLDAYIGQGYTNNYVGKIDEFRISNVARSAEEIAESYSLGKNKYLNTKITSTNLSSKTGLPFYIAADRPGSYLQTTIGESAFVNGLSDNNTAGYWRLDGDNYKDESGHNNDGLQEYLGIDYGIRSSNLTIIANQWNGGANDGELDITCTGGDAACYIVTIDGRTLSTPTINYGVAMIENAVVPAFIMYSPSLSAQGITAYTNNSDHYIGVRHNGASWQYDNNSAWVDFTPNKTNILIASLNTGNPSITNLKTVYHPTSTLGKISFGKYFNGTNNTISVKNNSSIDINGSGSAATIEMWVKPSTLAPTWQCLLYKNNGGTDGNQASNSDRQYTMWLHSSGFIHLTSTSVNNIGVAQTSFSTPAGLVAAGKWHHLVGVIDSPNSIMRIYINGQEAARTSYSNTGIRSAPGDLFFGSTNGYGNFFQGAIDEVRISKVARSADEIRQAYEYGMGLRSHPITIDFAAKLDGANLISDSNDLSFTIDATYHGLSQKGSKLFTGDKIIVRENYDGTQYLAQGTVSGVNVSTGATTVSAWDSGSTFPPSGFSVYADVFKWQREYWRVDGKTLDSHLDAITNLTLRLTDGSEGRTIWLDDLRSSGEYMSNPAGTSLTSDINNRYFQYRAIINSSDEYVSPYLSSTTLDYVANSIPNTPTLNSPADVATNQSPTPTLQTTATDDDSDYLRYKIELCTNLAMTTSCQIFDQTSSQTGWSGQNTQTSTAYTSGTQATYTLQSDLLPNTTYYWRSYAVDPGATNIWSATQVTPRSFTTSAGPSAPTDLQTEGATNPISVADLTPEFSAIHNDPNGDSAIYYEIEVNTTSDFSGTVMWNSGKQSMTSTANGVRSPQISYAGSTLSFNGAVYYWRIKFWDSFDIEGTWSATNNFTMSAPPNIPLLDSPPNAGIDVAFKPILQTTGTDNDSDYLRYKIELCTNLAMTTSCQIFDQTSSQTGWSGQNTQTSTAYTSGTQATYTLQSDLLPNTTYYWRSYAVDPAGSNTWSATQATPRSFTTLATPLPASACYLQKNITNDQILLTWTDNASNEDYYEVQRSVNGGAWTTLQNGLPPNTNNLLDTGVSPDNTYQYRVAPYFTGPMYAAWCVASQLNLGIGLFNLEGINASGLHFN